MARFAKKSEAEVLAELDAAEAEGTDGIEPEPRKKPRRRQEPEPPAPPRPQQASPQQQTPPRRTVTPPVRPQQYQEEAESVVQENLDNLDDLLNEETTDGGEDFLNIFDDISPANDQVEETVSTGPLEEVEFSLDDVPLSLDDMPELQPEPEPVPPPRAEKTRSQTALRHPEPIIEKPEPSVSSNVLDNTAPKETSHKSKFSHVKIPGNERVETAPKETLANRTQKTKSSTLKDVELASLVIKLYEAIQCLSPEERSIASQFISQEENIGEDYAKFAIAAINVDEMLTPTLSALTQAKELDAVNRAFFIMGLDNDLLENVGGLVEVLSGMEINKDIKDKIGYSREIVSLVEELAPEAIAYVEATESIISVVKRNQS